MGERTLVFLEIYRVTLMFLAMHIIQERSENFYLALFIKDLRLCTSSKEMLRWNYKPLGRMLEAQPNRQVQPLPKQILQEALVT